jgi:hypothetical protein
MTVFHASDGRGEGVLLDLRGHGSRMECSLCGRTKHASQVEEDESRGIEATSDCYRVMVTEWKSQRRGRRPPLDTSFLNIPPRLDVDETRSVHYYAPLTRTPTTGKSI